MASNSSSYIPDDELIRKIESGEAEEWEIPFVCDECGIFQQGGNLSNKSNSNRIICMNCPSPEETLQYKVTRETSEIVSEIENSGI